MTTTITDTLPDARAALVDVRLGGTLSVRINRTNTLAHVRVLAIYEGFGLFVESALPQETQFGPATRWHIITNVYRRDAITGTKYTVDAECGVLTAGIGQPIPGHGNALAEVAR